MHKKYYFFIFAFLATLCNEISAFDTLIEAKASYFCPSDRIFRKIYSGGGMYGGEITSQAWENIYGWLSAEYFEKNGSSIGESDRTHIELVPLALGLKYFFSCNYADFYAGAGVLATHVFIRDDSPYVVRNNSNWGVGGIVKAGAVINFCDSFFVDLFTSYSSIKVPFHDNDGVRRHHADLSGWAFGVGIGYRFDCGQW